MRERTNEQDSDNDKAQESDIESTLGPELLIANGINGRVNSDHAGHRSHMTGLCAIPFIGHPIRCMRL
ncbi:hypothetical protein HYDPIDRAFT_118632 [Hydnomerulius pinastri MD-312]|uniref:Uncharacterized protein n=1 Tax=Hydnomerulius pinastri MD-312 TaxID=994086 RepID=A0A0C9W8E6_9AGAM|nr:hypothetical protein HYDPIDRAFT_118632 [Hydnomerulius pinastri MD-312]